MKDYLRKIQSKINSVDPRRNLMLGDLIDPVINNIPSIIQITNNGGQVFQIGISAYHPELCNRYKAKELNDIGTIAILDKAKEELFKYTKVCYSD